MTKELRRVPLDFAWPLHTTWEGFVNPYHMTEDCGACGGRGWSPDYLRLMAEWYGRHAEDWVWLRAGEMRYNRAAWQYNLDVPDVQVLFAEGRLRNLPGVAEGETPTPEAVNRWAIHGFGHDAINAHLCIAAKCTRLGLPQTCAVCKGEGGFYASPEAKVLAEAWTRTDPPTGEGYQLWNDDCPISHVFRSLAKLCDWAAEHATTFGSGRASAQQWMDMLSTRGHVWVEQGNMILM